MVWMMAGIVFIAQLICCICFKDKIKRYLPTLIAAAFITVTVLNATFGEMDPERLVAQTEVTLIGAAAIVLYHSVCAVRSLVSRKRDPAQKLRK